MDLGIAKASFLGELDKIARDLTEEAREHIAKKNFAVSAKASNTGKPAYPIPDKVHARSALGFAAMHHDPKDIAEVRKDVAAKFPGMVKKKEAGLANAARTVAAHGLDVAHGAIGTAFGPPLRAAGGLGGVLRGEPGASYDLARGLGGVGALAGIEEAGRRKGKKSEEKKHIHEERMRAAEKVSCMDSGSVKAAFALLPTLFLKEGGVLGTLGKT
jgi:hypothetical protein